MTRFWQIVCAALLAFVFIVFMLPVSRPYEEPPMWRRLAGLALCSVPVTVAWAILFRTQVEQLRPSLASIFVLMAMQAALVWYIMAVNPGIFANR